MSGKVLFEDIFAVRDVDPGGKKFDKVSRFIGHSEQFDMDLLLDVNVDVYPLQRDDKFALALAPTLNLDGSQDEGFFDQSKKKSLMDQYEYVTYGKLYQWGGLEGSKAEVHISYGGLLMRLAGDMSHLKDLKLDQRLYCLIRRVS
eukprot:SM000091S24644  [mRNA]  locus=s91:493486:494553:- [translate_table: standard]